MKGPPTRRAGGPITGNPGGPITLAKSAHTGPKLLANDKPANIMLTHLDDEGEQRILLTDFGIARNVNDISGLTKTNMTVGTVAYCSPEQLLGVDIDGRADQYSLAATAFHLLTGSQLFPHSNPAVVISRHLNSPPPLLADSHPELAALDPVLAVALARDPKRRFPRSGDFALALAEQADVRGIRPSASTAPAPTPRRSISPQDGRAEPASPTAATTNKISRPRLIAFIALPIIALLGVIAIVWRPWDHRLTSPSAVTSSQAPTPSQSINSPLPPPTPPPPLPTTSSTTTMTTTTTTLNRNSPSGSCFRNQLGMVSEPEIKTSYSLCTSAGWVHVDSPLVSSGACAHTGTVGPHADGTYTICTPAGWVDVNRSVCADFGDYFKDPDPLAYHC